ncbi:MAG: NAD-dependent epimerase/dehydratase family protein [Candidatus Atribacteria bacterium]|nr:NAD-dependent epimerase/dehydratase family protein [Candidatus Atribacteria bacterium]
MKILVTGSEGFIGKHLCAALIAADHIVLKLDIALGVDIADEKWVNEIEEFDILYHLAAITFVPDSFNYPHRFFKTNFLGTLNALEACRKYKAKMVYISSYVYGAPITIPVNEQHAISAHNPYAQSKIIGEDLCRSFNRDFDVKIVIIRPFNVFGYGQNKSFLIPSIFNQASNGLVTLMDARPKRDLLYIDDFIDGLLTLTVKEFPSIEIFNMGSGASISVANLAEIISKFYDFEVAIEYTNQYRQGEILETKADISKAEKQLGWSPKYTIEDALRIIYLKTIENESV